MALRSLSHHDMKGMDTFYGIPQESHTTHFTVVLAVVVIALLPFVVWFCLRLRKPSKRSEQEAQKQDTENHRSNHHDTPYGLDAYSVLGVRRGDSFDEIRRAYRERMKEYHPDRVAYLGEELRELAERKAKQINMAFGELKTKYRVD
jgi:flagellar biosynthesis/type III secretory pathway M-ring protein FliF/YscJ